MVISCSMHGYKLIEAYERAEYEHHDSVAYICYDIIIFAIVCYSSGEFYVSTTRSHSSR